MTGPQSNPTPYGSNILSSLLREAVVDSPVKILPPRYPLTKLRFRPPRKTQISRLHSPHLQSAHHRVRWPPSLLEVVLGDFFDQSVAGVAGIAWRTGLCWDFQLLVASEIFGDRSPFEKLTIAHRPNETCCRRRLVYKSLEYGGPTGKPSRQGKGERLLCVEKVALIMWAS